MIRGTARREHVVVIDEETIRDKRLSWEARGLLAYLLSLPDDWEVSFQQLSEASPTDHASTLRVALQELIAYGYAGLAAVQATDTGGVA